MSGREDRTSETADGAPDDGIEWRSSAAARSAARWPPARPAGPPRRGPRTPRRAVSAAARRPLRPRGRPHPAGVRHRRGCRRSPSRPASTSGATAPGGAAALRAVGAGPSGWPDSNMFWQPALEQLIDRAAAAQPTVELRRGVRGRRDRRRRRRRHAARRADGDGEPECRGPLRRGLRRGQQHRARPARHRRSTDLGFFYDWLIVDIVLHEPRCSTPSTSRSAIPAGRRPRCRAGPGRRRWEFMRLPTRRSTSSTTWTGPGSCSSRGTYAGQRRARTSRRLRFQARWADSGARATCLLAGDAAHQMPPFAGQGMCSGLRDAANLAWKLDLVLPGAPRRRCSNATSVERMANVRASSTSRWRSARSSASPTRRRRLIAMP